MSASRRRARTFHWSRALTAVALLSMATCSHGPSDGESSAAITGSGGEPTGPSSPAVLGWPGAVTTAATAESAQLPGAGTVDPTTGQYSYTFPIALPPGRADMTPTVALVYTSDGANGVAGAGWSISGDSAIQICQRTFATDGSVAPMTFDGKDALCLDGERLVDASGGAGTEFRTERESFAKIQAPGNTLAPNAYVVWLKSGRIRTYTQIDPNVPSSDWVLTQEQDREGNTITYRYQGSPFTPLADEHYIYQIQYAGRTAGSQPGLRTVSFGYELRPDTYSAVIANGTTSHRRSVHLRLKTIAVTGPMPTTTGATSVAVSTIGTYTLGYTTSSATGRSLLTNIHHGGSLAGSESDRVFAYQSDTLFPAAGPQYRDTGIVISPSRLTDSTDGTKLSHFIVADFDHDGRDEILTSANSFGPGGILINPRQIQSGTGNHALELTYSAFSNLQLMGGIAGDLRGDGVPSVLAVSRNDQQFHEVRWDPGASAFVDAGTLFTPDGPITANFKDSTYYVQTALYLADLDGDGDQDLIKWSPGLWLAYFTQGSGTTYLRDWSGPFGGCIGYQPLDRTGQGAPYGGFFLHDPAGRAVGYLYNATSGCGSQGGVLTELQPFSMAITATNSSNPYYHVDPNVPAIRWLGSLNPATAGHCTIDTAGTEDGRPWVCPTDTGTCTHSLAGSYYCEAPDQPLVSWSRCAIGNLDGASPYEGYCWDGSEATWALGSMRVFDLDGDGHEEIIASSDLITNQSVLISFDANGNRTVSPFGNVPYAIGDFNGDGLLDYVGGTTQQVVFNGGPTVHLATKRTGDWLTQVSDAHAPAPTEKIVYSQAWAPTVSTTACAYPVSCLRSAMHVVTEHDVYQGPEVGTYRRAFYAFDDARADVAGRGFLGFGSARVWEPDVPRETFTTFDNVTTDETTHYAFLPKTRTTWVPTGYVAQPGSGTQAVNVRITQETNGYAKKWITNSSFFTYPQTWSVVESEGSGSLNWNAGSTAHFSVASPLVMRKRNGSELWDNYGNLTFATDATTGGVTRTNTAGFSPPDNSNWIVGRVASLSNSVTAPGQSVTPRTIAFTYDDPAHPLRPTTITHEPSTTNAELWSQTAFVYNADGLPTAITGYAKDPNNNNAILSRATVVTYDPDEGEFPRTLKNALGHITYVLYHPAFATVVDTIDPNGVEAATTLDDLGRTVSSWAAGSTKVNTAYSPWTDANGFVLGTQVDRSGTGVVTTRVQVSSSGRTVTQQHIGFDGNWIVTQASYDVLGRLVAESRPGVGAPATNGTSYLYDSLDRLLNMTLPDGNTVVYSHSFLRSDTYDSLAHHTFVVRNADGQVVQSAEDTTGPKTLLTTFSFGNFGALLSATDPQGHVTSMTYDVRGRRTQIVDPDRGTLVTHYNGFGEVASEIDSGHTRTFHYDALGRITQRSDADGTTTYAWDTAPSGLGKPASSTSADGTIKQYAYDGYSRLTDTTWTIDGEAFDVAAAYDSVGRILTVSYPAVAGRARFTVQNNFTPSNYLANMTETDAGAPGRVFFTVNGRNVDDRLTSQKLGNLVVDGRTYDPALGRIKSQMATYGRGTLFSVGYDYNSDGTLKTRTDYARSRTETYGYDPLHRLTSWALTYGTTTRSVGYQYDDLGNLKTLTLDGATTETDYYGCPGTGFCFAPKPHQLVQTQQTLGMFTLSTNYGYDDRGRQTSSSSRTIAFTEFDLPRSLTAGGATATFRYDADNKRVKKIGTAAGVATIELAGLYERRQTPSGTQHLFLVGGPDGGIAQVTFNPATLTDTVEYVLQDRLGTSALVTNASGQVSAWLDHEPFGGRVNPDGTARSTNPSDVRVGFTGHLEDDEMGLIHMRGRTYDPAIRHFLSTDPHVGSPHSAQAYNHYAYARNSPTNFVDPTGFEVVCVDTASGEICYDVPDGAGAGYCVEEACGGASTVGGGDSGGNPVVGGGGGGGGPPNWPTVVSPAPLGPPHDAIDRNAAASAPAAGNEVTINWAAVTYRLGMSGLENVDSLDSYMRWSWDLSWQYFLGGHPTVTQAIDKTLSGLGLNELDKQAMFHSMGMVAMEAASNEAAVMRSVGVGLPPGAMVGPPPGATADMITVDVVPPFNGRYNIAQISEQALQAAAEQMERAAGAEAVQSRYTTVPEFRREILRLMGTGNFADMMGVPDDSPVFPPISPGGELLDRFGIGNMTANKAGLLGPQSALGSAPGATPGVQLTFSRSGPQGLICTGVWCSASNRGGQPATNVLTGDVRGP